MTEIFKPIPGFKDDYQVSNLGNVKRITTNKILKPRGNAISRLRVMILTDEGKRKDMKIHQLVAMAFLNHVPDGTQNIVVDHINNDQLDNRLGNLQLITQRENCSKDKNTGLPTGVYRSGNGKFRARIRISGKLINIGTYSTKQEASNAYYDALKNINN